VLQEALDFDALIEVAAGHVVAEDFFAVFVQAGLVWLFVHAIDGRASEGHEAASDSFVGEEHVFLNKLVGDVVLDFFNADHAAAFVETDLHFRKVECQGASSETCPPDFLGEIIGMMEHALDIARGFALKDRKGFAIGEAALGVNDSGMEFGFQNSAVMGKKEFNGFGEAVDSGLKGTKFVAERFRQHGDDPVHKVSGISAFAGLGIEGGGGLHVMGNVGDVDPEAPAVPGWFKVYGVVEVFGVVWIDGDDVVTAAIRAAMKVPGRNGDAEGTGLLQGAFRKVEREIVLAKDGKHIDAFGIGRPEDFDDFAFGTHGAGFPFDKFDDHFVTDVCRASDVPGSGNVDIVRDAWIIWNDIEGIATTLEGADELLAVALENANDGAALGGAFAMSTARAAITTDENTILVKSSAGVVFGNRNFFECGVVRLEETSARTSHADAAGNEINLAGKDITITLYADDLTGMLECMKELFKFAFVSRRQA
jgi:hypothetical protein